MVGAMVGCGSDERAKIREEERAKLKQEQTRSVEEDERIRQKIRIADQRREDCLKECNKKFDARSTGVGLLEMDLKLLSNCTQHCDRKYHMDR
jgi:hypothetical protein